MPDDAQATPTPNAPIHNGTPARVYPRDASGMFLPGQPGRPPGIKDKRSKSAQEILDAYATEPLVEKMEQLKRLKAKLQANVWRYDQEETDTEKLIERLTSDIMQYRHQRLKTVESHTQLDIVHKLQTIQTMSDDELKQALAEAQELVKRLPSGH